MKASHSVALITQGYTVMVKRININADGFDELREWESVNGEYVRFEDVRTLEARNTITRNG